MFTGREAGWEECFVACGDRKEGVGDEGLEGGFGYWDDEPDCLRGGVVSGVDRTGGYGGNGGEGSGVGRGMGGKERRRTGFVACCSEIWIIDGKGVGAVGVRSQLGRGE